MKVQIMRTTKNPNPRKFVRGVAWCGVWVSISIYFGVRVSVATMRGVALFHNQCFGKVAREPTNQPTMSNSSVPNNVTCCDGGEEVLPRAQVHFDVVSITVFSLVVILLSFLVVVIVRLREKMALQAQLEEGVASHDRKAERRIARNKFISNGLTIKEWVPPNDQQVVLESTEEDEDSPRSAETVEASQPPAPAPPINSSLVSCTMGSDDCDSLEGEEEMAGCAICLRHFKPQQLVCESNNPLCRHIFHKDCMVDWLTKLHDECPMCREVYLLQTTV
jgi:hypothetical protein